MIEALEARLEEALLWRKMAVFTAVLALQADDRLLAIEKELIAAKREKKKGAK